ncbi:MAG: hypothetical protein LBD09_06700, partial [Treponema sp.]|nr:hypothetical protein [Treponema sp.]
MPLALAAGIFLSCRSAPARAPAPEFSLVFDRVDMTGPGRVNLHFTLEAENLRDSAAVLSLAGYRLSVGEAVAGGTGDTNGGTGANGGTGTSGGTAASRGVLEFPAPGPDGTATALRLGPRGRKEIPVILHLDPDSIPAGTGDSAAAALAMNIAVSYGDGAKVSAAVRGRAEFPLIRDPVFSITSIVIMQAELINTRFKVRVRVDNPNPFPVELSSFKYELYGGGRFWADGTEQRVLSVPAAGRAEKELFLVMNFIDMKRDLLDQVIALEQVR